jgi:tetratricopeptide (TPR) repeat protein
LPAYPPLAQRNTHQALRVTIVPAEGEPWHGRGRASAGQGRWAEALAAYSQAIAAGASHPAVWLDRGTAYAMLAQYDDAAKDFARAVDARPGDSYLWYQHAIAKLVAGDRDAYRGVCTDMLKRFGQSRNPGVAQRILYACLPAPDALPDMAVLLPLAELAATRKDNARLLGAALVRAGKYQAAIEPLKKGQARAWDHLFLAMAHHHLGHTVEACQHLERATRQVKTAGYPWPENMESEHLRREVEALIKGTGNKRPAPKE